MILDRIIFVFTMGLAVFSKSVLLVQYAFYSIALPFLSVKEKGLTPDSPLTRLEAL